jgi:chaperonin GroES
MTLTPLGNKILVKPLKEEEKSTSGIFIPDSVKGKEQPNLGEVVAVGNDDVPVNVGDIILFKKYTPDELEVNDEKLLIMDEGDILGIYGEREEAI